MSYTMEDFKHDYVKKHFPRLTLEEQQEVLQSLPPRQKGTVIFSAFAYRKR